MSETTLTGLLDTVWSHIGRGVADRKHPARHPTLATIGPDGPDLRTLVLRGASRAEATLDLHTDAASPKVAQIDRDPRVALHIWLPKSKLQIRLRATAEIQAGDPALFAKLPTEAQANYAGLAPGALLSAAPDPRPGQDRFTQVICHISEIDALVLSAPHQRALFRRSEAWAGAWIAP